LDLKLPLLESVLVSNNEHIDRAAEAILSLGQRRISIIGLSFKAGTDDLRESAVVYLVKKLIAEGCDIRIWDENVVLGQLIGSNREFIEAYIPHIGMLLRSNLEEVLAHGNVVVLGTNCLLREQLANRLSDDQHLIELANLMTLASKETSAMVAHS
jgi:GDP-mannose 6-dehydrogenase